MANVAICIGCDNYNDQYLSELHGAVEDASRIFSLLTDSDLYDETSSKLLISPNIQEVRDCLYHIVSQQNIGVLTVYFAGHGGIKSGTFYLCFKDSEIAKFSTTALPIMDLFAVIGEARPRQVNMIVDACQAAGTMFDLGSLTKPEVVGQAGSSSIAFLAACASNQYAEELRSGGIATTALARYITGEKSVQQNRRFLDLIEVGLAVSRDVSAVSESQIPTAWGLNLYGDGVFAFNPHYQDSGTEPPFSVEGIAPTSSEGLRIQSRADSLWDEYRRLTTEPDPARLRQTIAQLQNDLGESFAQFVKGLATTLVARSNKSPDLLAGSDALAVCALTLLPQLGSRGVLESCREMLVSRAQHDIRILADLNKAMQADKYSLLSSSHALADLHYLPMRVSRLLAWIALARAARDSLNLIDDRVDAESNALVNFLFEHYIGSMVSVSEEQAPWTLIFASLANQFDWDDKARLLVDRLMASALLADGQILRLGAPGGVAFNYALARAGIQSPIAHDDFANPSELLSVLVLFGARFGLFDIWDRHLIRLDGRTINTYVPDSYSSFGETVIIGGKNFTNRIGHGIWTLSEFAQTFTSTIWPDVELATQGLSKEGRILCALSAYLFPDRVPYFLLDGTLSSVR